MRFHTASLAAVTTLLVAGSVHAADEPRFSLRDRSLVVDGDAHEELPIPCTDVFSAARRRDRIFVACGKQGLAVFVAEDSVHWRFEEMQASRVSCVDVTTEGQCVGAAPASPVEEPATTVTHITGAPTDLEVQAKNADGTWSTVCTGACDRPLRSDATYRIDGPGLRASKPFWIEGRDIRLSVTTGSWAGFSGGLLMVIVGIGGGVVGAGAVLLDGLIHAFCQYSCGQDTLLVPGLIGWLGGATVAAGGLFLMRANGPTRVGGAMSPRLPAWRELPSAPTTPRLGAVTTIPLFSGSF